MTSLWNSQEKKKKENGFVERGEREIGREKTWESVILVSEW